MSPRKMKLLDRMHKKFAVNDIYCKGKKRNIDEWKAFLEAFPAPKDCLEMSYEKYLCRKKYFSNKKLHIYDLFGCFAYIIEIPSLFVSLLLLRTIPINKKNSILVEKHTEVEYADVIPQSILEENPVIVDNCSKKYGLIYKEFGRFLADAVHRYPREHFFHYFLYKEFVAHSYFIRKYNPSKVVVYVNERNVATPIIKEIYKNSRRELVSFMHGEYAWDLHLSFMSFSSYYIWDNKYEKMFKSQLRSNIDNFIIYTPQKLKKKWNLENVEWRYDYTYYLNGEEKDELIVIFNNMNKLAASGKRCKIRPHPRDNEYFYNNVGYLQGVHIEDAQIVSIEESLGNTEYAIGLKTTVLSEAWVEGRKTIIDDISNKELYVELNKIDYIILQRTSLRLSSFIDN